MAEYRTEQKRLLLDFLEKNSDNSYTVDEIVEGLCESEGENAPGRSTVYRLMTRLVEERRVHRFSDEGSRRFLYRIVADDHCRTHLHLKCMQCGKILHLDGDTSSALLEQVQKVKGFSIDKEESLLFGNCADCKGDER